MHTTNYTNTFIEIAEDSPIQSAEVPPMKGEKKTIAGMQFDMIAHQPYRYTSDEVIFGIHAKRNEIPAREIEEERNKFFSKGQACLRSSPLSKRYGWGIHSNEEGKVAIFPAESEEYKKLASDSGVTHLKAMRSRKG